MDTFSEIMNTTITLWDLIYARWISEELFSYRWFITLATMVVIYTLLYLFIDRRRMRELFLFGSLLSVGYGYADIIGATVGLWAYKSHFVPFKPSLLPYSYTIHPIVHMFAYQYTSNWRSFIIANTVAAAFFAFIAQPFFVWVGILWFQNWNYFYSFIIAWGLAVFARALVLWMAKVEQNHAPEKVRVSFSPEIQPAMKPLDEDKE